MLHFGLLPAPYTTYAVVSASLVPLISFHLPAFCLEMAKLVPTKALPIFGVFTPVFRGLLFFWEIVRFDFDQRDEGDFFWGAQSLESHLTRCKTMSLYGLSSRYARLRTFSHDPATWQRMLYQWIVEFQTKSFLIGFLEDI